MFQVTFVFDCRKDDFWNTYVGNMCKRLIDLRDCISFHAMKTERHHTVPDLTVKELRRMIKDHTGVHLKLHESAASVTCIPSDGIDLPVHLADTVIEKFDLSSSENKPGEVMIDLYPKSA